MRAIVTGSAGFIGQHLVRRLEASGWTVTGIDRKSGPAIECDPSLPANAEAIFHLASPVGPLGVLTQAGTIVTQVIETTDIVRGWALSYGCPLIDVSTSEVYGSGHADQEGDVCTFQAATSARKEYAVAKLAAETMLRNTTGLDVRIVRPFNVAGPGQLSEGGFVLPRFIEQALAGEPLTVYLPGTQLRSLTHVYDVVDGLIAAYERGRPGAVYNLGNPANKCTIWELAEEVVREVHGGHPVLVDPVWLHGPAFHEAPDKLPVAEKAARELGWHPTRSRHEIIRDILIAPRMAWFSETRPEWFMSA